MDLQTSWESDLFHMDRWDMNINLNMGLDFPENVNYEVPDPEDEVEDWTEPCLFPILATLDNPSLACNSHNNDDDNDNASEAAGYGPDGCERDPEPPVFQANSSSANATSDSESDRMMSPSHDQSFTLTPDDRDHPSDVIVLVSVNKGRRFDQRYRRILRGLRHEATLMTVENADQLDAVIYEHERRIRAFVVTDAGIMKPEHEMLTFRLAGIVALPFNAWSVIFAFDFAIQAATMPEMFTAYMQRNFDVSWKIRGVVRGRAIARMDSLNSSRVPDRKYSGKYWLKRAVLLSEVDREDRLMVLSRRRGGLLPTPSSSSLSHESTNLGASDDNNNGEYFPDVAPATRNLSFVQHSALIRETALRLVDVNDYLNDTPVAMREYHRVSRPPECRPWCGYLGFVGYSQDHKHLAGVILGMSGVWKPEYRRMWDDYARAGGGGAGVYFGENWGETYDQQI